MHNDIVKVKRIRFAQIALIFLIDACYLLLTVVLSRFERKRIRREKLVLGVADGIDNGFNRQKLFVNVQSFHGGNHCLFGVVGIVNGKTGAISHTLAMLAQNAHANGVKGACPNVGGGVFLFGEHTCQTLFDFVCCLVGKGNGKHTVGLTRIVGKLRQDMLANCLGLQQHGALKLGYACFVCSVGDVVAKIGIAVTNDKGNAAHKNRCFATACARENEERIVYGEYRFALTFIQFLKCFVKQSALDRKVTLFNQGLHEDPF